MKITIIGIPDRLPEFSSELRQIVKSHRIFSGGKRHHELVQCILPEQYQWIDITVPLSNVFDQYKQQQEDMIVFASGDPMFYGFGITLQRELPDLDLEIHAWFNSLQMLAHKALLPYHDMINVSCTGRPWKALDTALIQDHGIIGVLTDRRKTPNAIAERMLEYGFTNYRMIVGEALDGPNEHIYHLSLQEASKRNFGPLNNLILIREKQRAKLHGIPDSKFHILPGRPKMMTKAPIRLLSLAQLELQNKACFWDVGFCTGSVSIEARLQFPHLDIYSFEIRKEGKALMEQNSRQFNAPGINSFIGDFLSTDISELPSPDAIFIGGHGGKLEEIMTTLDRKISKGTTIVINAVKDTSSDEFKRVSKLLNYHIEKPLLVQIDEHNPINIITAKKV
ncbi:precorrin-6y C5,15-methyltransferase (decarboxylating) subunit CbiE [Puteibacter caeruleilacunae]|nr:precorrin-6y C5,15-methyltransferase (decarboxylating) subunit CbiE [Puteibacter caeruleilacunae]